MNVVLKINRIEFMYKATFNPNETIKEFPLF